MNNDLNDLKECLTNRSPVLYLGAGFSYECKNHKGDSIQLGKGLCRIMFDHFWADNSSYDILNRYRSLATECVNTSNLKKLCTILRNNKLIDERNSLLRDYFSGCKIDAEDVRNVICEYPWERIFTVNIDDLVENIYSFNDHIINVWNRENDVKRHNHNYPTLIKLHGCVRNPQSNYVFDDTEYIQFMANNDYILNEFGDAFSKNDIVFIGTEFQEDDLKVIIDRFINMGYDAPSINNYYFITPTIYDEMFSLTIEESPHMHHIKMTTTDFFTFLKNDVNIYNEQLNKLNEYGLVSVYERYKMIPSLYSSELYHGKDITYSDLKYHWDISTSNIEIIEWAKIDDNNKIISIYGDDYVGKTCVAKRLLYDFFASSYDCYELKMDSEDRIELFLDYINQLTNNCIAVLFEGAAYSYGLIVRKLIDNNPTNKRIIIITTDILVNHKRKYHSLDGNKYCKKIFITEKIDYSRATLIYDKLLEKKSLSRLYDISDKRDCVISYMMENNDIIDVLYVSSLGRGFKDHIRTYIIGELEDKANYNKYICLLCILSRIGINYIPIYLFILSAKVIDKNISQQLFEKNFRIILQIENSSYHLRYTRYLSEKYSDVLEKEEIKNIIIVLIKHVTGRFNEGDYNEFSAILYKLLNLKSLSILLPINTVKELYLSIENICEQYSYYWVQRGLCSQKQSSPDFEEADRFLREAKTIRPKSYQVEHAIAKNLIERGLVALQDDINDSEFFFKGLEEMQALIDDEHYSKAFGYSLHAFIESLLKYSKITNIVIDSHYCIMINEYVSHFDSNNTEPMLSNVFLKLKNYAYHNRVSVYLKNITNKYWKKYSIENSEDEFIESDWQN